MSECTLYLLAVSPRLAFSPQNYFVALPWHYVIKGFFLCQGKNSGVVVPFQSSCLHTGGFFGVLLFIKSSLPSKRSYSFLLKDHH